MDKFKDDMRCGEKRFVKPKEWNDNCGHHSKCDENYRLGRELIDSAINMENSLASYIDGSSNKKPCGGNNNSSSTLGFAALIEMAVLAKLFIGLGTIHHDKILEILYMLKDKFDMDDMDFRKIILFFQKQDWGNLAKTVLDYARENLDLKI